MSELLFFYYKSPTVETAESRYWVEGGTGNTNSTTNWSEDNGGVSGASLPTSELNAKWTGNSGSGTATINATFACRDFNSTNFTGTIAGSSQLQCYGSLIIGAGVTRNYTSSTTLLATTTGHVVTTNGKAMLNNTTFNGAGGGWTLTDDYNNAGRFITVNNGSPDFGSNTVTCSNFNVIGGTPITENMNIVNTGFINGNSLSYGDVTTTHAGGTNNVAGSNTFDNYSLINTGGYGAQTVTGGTTQTINEDYVISGNNATTERACQKPLTSGTAVNIVVNGTASITNTDLIGMVYTGTATPVAAPGVGDGGGNSGITFDAPKTVYWKDSGVASTSLLSDNYVTTSGGVTPATALLQDTVNIDANSIATTGRTLAMSTSKGRYPGLDFTGATNTPTLSITQESYVYGSVTLISAMTLSGTSFLYMAGDKDMTFTSAGKTLPFSFRVDAFDGSVTIQDALSCGGFSVINGDFDFNNQTATVSAYIGTGTGNTNLRDVQLTFASEGSPFTNIAPRTMSGTTASVKYTYSGANATSLPLGGATLPQFWNATGSTSICTISNACTITELKSDASRSFKFPAGQIVSVETLNIGINCTFASTTASQATIDNTSGIAHTATGTTVTNINYTGAGLTVTGGVDGGGNTGVTFV